jgi:hypothetical protein
MTTTPESAASRLEAIQAERAKLKAQLDSLRAEAEPAAALAKAEIELANEKALVAATIKYGPIGEKWDALLTRLGVVIVKRAHDAHFRAYQEDAEFTFEKTEAFVRRCVEYPDLTAFDAITKELPGVLADLSNAVCKLMGMKAAEQVKK